MSVPILDFSGLGSCSWARRTAALALISGAALVSCGSSSDRPGAPTTGAGAAGGAGGQAGSGATSGGGAGGQGATAGVTGELDCVSSPMQASGSVEGLGILTTGPNQGRAVFLGEQWANQHSLDAYTAWSWGTEFTPTPSGQGHLASPSGSQYCVGETSWSKAYDASAARKGEIKYSKISALGACSSANGATGTLNYCSRDPNHIGTAPADCPVGALHIWGSVGSRAIDESEELLFGDSSGTPLVDLTAVFGQGRLIQLQDSTASAEVRAEIGVIRTEVEGQSVVFCVNNVVDTSQTSLTQLELQVTELGTCPGSALSDSVTACL